MSFNKSKNTSTTKYSDVIVNNLTFTEMKETERTKGQKIAFPNYISASGESKILYIQLPEIMLEMYGVPRLGDYYKDDMARSFIKLPLNQSIKEIQEFSKIIKELDNKLGSDEFKEKTFGNKSKKYNYQSIFRLPNEIEEEEETTKNKKTNIPRIPYMKLKLNTQYPSNNIITTIFLKDKVKNEYSQIDDITDLDSFCKYVCYQSKLKAIIAPVKLWAQASNIPNASYGVTFKIIKAQVDPPINTSISIKDYLNNRDGFLNSDSEEEEVEEKVVKNNASSSSHKKEESKKEESKKEESKKEESKKEESKKEDSKEESKKEIISEEEDEEDEEDNDEESE